MLNIIKLAPPIPSSKTMVLSEGDWVIIQYVHSLAVKAIKVMLFIITKALPCIKYNAFI